jgi:hypothetical protein
MGTNYYYHEPDANRCPHCGRCDEGSIIHIGKSSVGWCFSLHVTDEIRSLTDWTQKWTEGGRIVDEYGEELTPAAMLERITVRQSRPASDAAHERYEMKINHASPGPNGLWRHSLVGSCVAHGIGTWDLVEGEFS